MKATRRQFIWIPTPSLHLQGVTGGVKNHPLLPLSPPPVPPYINAHAIMHTLHIFNLPLSSPLPPHDPPYFCALNKTCTTKTSTSDSPFKLVDFAFQEKDRLVCTCEKKLLLSMVRTQADPFPIRIQSCAPEQDTFRITT